MAPTSAVQPEPAADAGHAPGEAPPSQANKRAFGPRDHVQVLEWNRELPRTEQERVDALEGRCRAQPDAPAVDGWNGRLTYGELDRASSALAARLAGLGVGPEVVVPLCFEKSRWAVVAVVTVVKAGGAFALLDGSLPLERMQATCNQVKAETVLTSRRHAATGARLARRVVVVGPESDLGGDGPAPTRAGGGPGDALYVVFTSGSTGRPKGVVIEHAAFGTAAHAHAEAFGLGPSSRTLRFSSYSFDVAMLELLTTLIAGGCICIPSDEDRLGDLARAITSLGANRLFLTPSVARLVEPADVPDVKTLVLAGEPVTAEDVRKWIGKVKLINGYGPAECSVLSTLRTDFGSSPDHRVIGRAVACLTWVVDPDDHDVLLPVGAVGELLIEGPVVGREYLGQPEMTRSSFISAPAWRRQFPQADGPSRLYKTGDVVQYAPDGSLRFLGRKDSQVKLRGQRLELGEVEHHVQSRFPPGSLVFAEVVSHPSDSLVVFIYQPGAAADPSPDVLAPLADDFSGQAQAIVAELSEILPAYMVPTAVLPLRRVPLTANGKADRVLLRAQAATRGLGPTSTVKRMPATWHKQQLAALWADVLALPLDAIGAEEDFFCRGGDSLTAMHMANRANRRGLFALPVSSVLAFPVLSDLAKTLSQPPPLETEPAVKPTWTVPDLHLKEIGEHNVEQILPTTELQRMYLKPGLKNYYLWEMPHVIDAHRLERACQQLADRHGALRSIFVRSHHEYYQVILKSLPVQLARAHSGDQSAQELAKSLCQGDFYRSLAQTEPFFQATLVSANGSKPVLVLRLSHAQFDAFSLERLLSELIDVCRGNSLATPAVDWPRYLTLRMACQAPSAVNFWRRYLEGAEMTPWKSLAPAQSPAKGQVMALAQSPPLKAPQGSMGTGLGPADPAVRPRFRPYHPRAKPARGRSQ